MQFKDVVGLDHIKSHLIQAVRNNKVPHAQLFLNRPGTGGLPLALAYTQYLVCQNPSEHDSCGVCPPCVKAQKMIHPDIHYTYPVIKPEGMKRAPLSEDFAKEWRSVITKNPYITEYEWILEINDENKQGNITRDEASQIIQKLTFKAFESRFKIQIIWMAENLAETGNTLLKLIEEPPGDTVIILIAENQEAILPTIISRTQIVNITNLQEDDIYVKLMNDYQLDEETAREYAYISNGNFRKAQQLATGELEGFGEDLKNWMIYCMRGPSIELVKWTETRHTKGREYLKKFFDYTLHIFRETIASKYTEDQLRPHVSKNEFPVVQALKKYVTYDNLYELIPKMEETAYHIERNSNAKISLLNLSIEMRKILRK